MTAHDDRLVKLMTITRAEFETSLRGLEPAASLDAAGDVQLRVEDSVVRLSFVGLAPRTIGGGLLRLPQARVTIDLSAVAPAARAGFVRRFEIAFQRGGG